MPTGFLEAEEIAGKDNLPFRTHLGVETWRQWSDAAITRAIPVLLALFLGVTLLTHLCRQY